MVETFQSNKIAKGADNIAGLTNLEAIAVSSRYFPVVSDLGKWSEGTGIIRGDGQSQDQGFQSTAWAMGSITLDQYLWVKSTLLRGQRSGWVTIQTRKHDRSRWVIANAILDIKQAPGQGKTLANYKPFVWTFSRITILEEQQMYGSIYVKDGAAQQADITTTPVLLTGFAVVGEQSGVTGNITTDTLTVAYGGVWKFDFSVNGTKTASQLYKFNIRVNAVEGVYQCQLASDALTSGHTSMSGLLDLDADDVVTVYVETDDATAGTHLTPQDMQLTLTSVSITS